MKSRIGYFIEDMGQLGLNNTSIKKLRSTFSSFNLYRKLRNRETRPTNLQFRNFFDDVTPQYLRNGKIPTSKELEQCYIKFEQLVKESLIRFIDFSIYIIPILVYKTIKFLYF